MIGSFNGYARDLVQVEDQYSGNQPDKLKIIQTTSHTQKFLLCSLGYSDKVHATPVE